MLEPVEPIKKQVDYDECIDITKNDLGDNVEFRTGLNPCKAFIMVLKELGYTDDEIKAAGIAAYGGKLKKKKKGLTY